MIKYYCDLCNKNVDENHEYALPMEFKIEQGATAVTGKFYSFSSRTVYEPVKCHLCENCSKIIALFIKGIKKGEHNE
jgi:uncharacterized protein YlaI